ncbi:ketoacyl-ACP synthase III [Halosquirtibacter laminarini]|uniref:Ketoacyl-ACP synthase III n=1 Tax=Halosquirtibacter laminarini TaxID=3374600 RepID=A0AC61NL27_9BACT|nr:ketoacyl-ACP synthase III [Prolixibacteraceae bacterium]
MENKIYTIITGSGASIPPRIVKNEEFVDHTFYQPGKKVPFETPGEEITSKFEAITCIAERRYVAEDQTASDLAVESAIAALEDAKLDKEELDFIIVAHNFGDVKSGSTRIDNMPSLANKVKDKLKIKNPSTFCHDNISGCPGWTQAMIIADAYIRAGFCRKGLVIGADVLSRVSDPHDRDTMIFADGAGAVIVEATESETPIGILSHESRSDGGKFSHALQMGSSWNPDYDQTEEVIKMAGNQIYVYALTTVPGVVKASIDKAGLDLKDIHKVFIHQANEKMDLAILERLYKLYKQKDVDYSIMPMSIRELGNSSTATVPTLFDLVRKNKIEGQSIESGQNIVFTSVGAGMNINSIIYRIP